MNENKEVYVPVISENEERKKNKNQGNSNTVISKEEKKAAIEKAFKCTDLYIDLGDLNKSYTYPHQKPIDLSDSLVKAVYKGFYKHIKEVLVAENHKKDHMIKYAGRLFRCYEIPTVGGGIVAARQMPPEFITLENSGMNKRYIKELMDPRLRSGGLIIICGAPGNGKTTTCAATIDKRLRDFGGLCITIEDPVEISLQGTRGKGTCLQIQVESQHEFPEAVRGIMRAYPTGTDSIMLIGETRDAETASEALRSSIDGRLVITTMHANSPLEALQRFANIASKIMDGTDVNNMLASSFRLAIHQELKMGKLIAQIIVDETDVQGAIREGKFQGLKTQLQTQDAKVKTGQPFDYMKRT
jgi:Tfp pilus assembly pilus retraction ATPase PilT